MGEIDRLSVRLQLLIDSSARLGPVARMTDDEAEGVRAAIDAARARGVLKWDATFEPIDWSEFD